MSRSLHCREALQTPLLVVLLLVPAGAAASDSTPPIVTGVRIEQRTDFGCLPDPGYYPYMPPVTLTMRIEEKESLIKAIAWRIADRSWVELDMNELDLSHPGIWTVHSDLIAQPGLPEDAKLQVRVVNAVDLAAISDPVDAILLYQEDVCDAEPEPQPDAGPTGPPKKVEGLGDPTATPDAGVQDASTAEASEPSGDSGGGGGGCAAGGQGGALPCSGVLLLLLAFLSFVGKLLRRRASV